MHDLHEGIFNHLTLRVPGHKDRYYQIPFGTHWSEVTASCFMEVDYDGEVVAGEGIVERSAYCIHAPMHKTMDHAAAVFHTHMPPHQHHIAMLTQHRNVAKKTSNCRKLPVTFVRPSGFHFLLS